MKRSLLLISLCFYSSFLFSQNVFYSNNATVFVADQAIVQINGGAVLDSSSSLLNQNGAVITIATNPDPGSFTINNSSVAQGDGKYRIEQDWINNASFIANFSEVELFGNSEQFISGTQVTTFHNLNLTGTGSGFGRIKRQLINSIIDSTGSLSLNDRELATDNFTMYVYNPAVASVKNNTAQGSEGFVSSTGSGRLVRNSNSPAAYVFPVGSSDGTFRYRPIELNRMNGNNTFAVRMANVDANSESLFRSSIQSFSFCKEEGLNEKYFHYVEQTAGSSSADISVYYDEAADGKFIGLSQWQTSGLKWKDMNHVNEGAATSYLSSMKRSGWDDYSNNAFILNSCEGIYVPNVFTPNGDGVNDLLHFMNAGMEEIHVQIWDRWGIKIFEATAPEISWDGRTNAGVKATDGTYYYILNARSENQEYPEQKGYFTLVK